MPVDDRIHRLGTGILALKETEYLGYAGTGDVQERLTHLCETLLALVESRYPRDAKAVTPPERVRALRFRIRRRLLDAEKPPTPDEKELLLDDLDRVFTALQAHSYIGDYLLVDPTLDRRAETLLKLEEDLFGFPTYPIAPHRPRHRRGADSRQRNARRRRNPRKRRGAATDGAAGKKIERAAEVRGMDVSSIRDYRAPKSGHSSVWLPSLRSHSACISSWDIVGRMPLANISKTHFS